MSELLKSPLFSGDEMFNALTPPKEAQMASPPMESMLAEPAKPLSGSFSEILKKLGVDSSGISMNELGKAQLTKKLQEKFGPSYKENPAALSAMSAFDKELEKYPMDAKKSLAKAAAIGERTLKALLGG